MKFKGGIRKSILDFAEQQAKDVLDPTKPAFLGNIFSEEMASLLRKAIKEEPAIHIWWDQHSKKNSIYGIRIEIDGKLENLFHIGFMADSYQDHMNHIDIKILCNESGKIFALNETEKTMREIP